MVASETPSTSRMIETPARTHLCGGALVFNYAKNTNVDAL